MKNYKIAIMGAGIIAATMADTLVKMEGIEAYAIASRSEKKALDFKNKFGMTRAYGSYEEMLDDPEVDLVYIATPHSEHLKNAKMCIDHNKPVLVEKSFTANEEQARELLSYGREKNVFITEAVWVRYMPFIKKIKEVVDSGIIGKPTMLTANLGYDVKDKPRMTDPNLCGGALLDVGVYPINFACMIFGSYPEKISATCTYTDRGVDEQDSITFLYEDGKMAVLNASMISVSDRKGIIHGDKGFIVIENINNFESMTVYDVEYKKIAFYERPEQISGYEYEVIKSVEAIESGKMECEDMPHKETIRVMEIMDEVRRQMNVIYPFEQ